MPTCPFVHRTGCAAWLDKHCVPCSRPCTMADWKFANRSGARDGARAPPELPNGSHRKAVRCSSYRKRRKKTSRCSCRFKQVQHALTSLDTWFMRGPSPYKPMPVVAVRATKQAVNDRLAELVGMHEIADLLGVSRQWVAKLKEDGRFPQPVAILAMGPVSPGGLYSGSARRRGVRRGR